MIKYLFIVINSLCIFIFGLFSGQEGITVSSNIPANMVAGQDVVIELKVNKGGMNGFAKLQLDLPEGIVVKEAEEKGANYSYKEGLAKWVWAALPLESEIIVKVTLVANENITGVKTIGAKYSYVENNVKQVIEMTPVEVNVLPPGSDVNAVATTNPVTTPKDSTSAPTPPATTTEPPGIVTATRQLSAGTVENEFLITIKIKKDGTKGFARFSDDIPGDVIVKGAKTDGGSFSVADGKIKFVWVNVPEKDELEISYTLRGNSANAVMLGGEYSYLEDNQSKKFKLPLETIAFQTPQVSKEKSVEVAKTETKEPEIKEPENTIPATAKSVEETLAKTLANKELDAVGKKIEGALNYEVQVGAFTNGKVNAGRIKKKFKIKEKLRSEMAEGFSKFMIGAHDTYSVARDQRNTMQSVNGVKSAFVVAYNQGKRITVQEALMITNQKWFK